MTLLILMLLAAEPALDGEPEVVVLNGVQEVDGCIVSTTSCRTFTAASYDPTSRRWPVWLMRKSQAIRRGVGEAVSASELVKELSKDKRSLQRSLPPESTC
jgi:hypothetical protein